MSNIFATGWRCSCGSWVYPDEDHNCVIYGSRTDIGPQLKGTFGWSGDERALNRIAEALERIAKALEK